MTDTRDPFGSSSDDASDSSASGEFHAALGRTLERVGDELSERYPGDSGERQPVHTVYGGAHLFRRDTAAKLGRVALRFLDRYGPDPIAFARAVGLPGAEKLPSDADPALLADRYDDDPDGMRTADPAVWLAHTVERRVRAKLRDEPVEDFRIDFEDGYGNRPDAEEDEDAAGAAREVAAGMEAGSLPPFLGIRIKPLNRELYGRALRTLERFLETVAAGTGGRLPDRFVVTLPKVMVPQHVAALASALDRFEERAGLPSGSVGVELMIETPQAILDADGRCAVPSLVEAARGRCVAAHFGVYDYTALCGITARHQRMGHPVCDFARQTMQVSLARSGVWLSDGATNVIPAPPHRPGTDGSDLTAEQERENRNAVHRAWRLHFDDVRRSLADGYYQGWDLNPGQLPTRYAALYSFFLESLEPAAERLRNFVEKAARATVAGDVFDDAATGQGLLNFFLRGLNCGAVTEEEALRTGLTLDELHSRSFTRILEGRQEGRSG